MALPGRLARFGRTVGGYLVATGLVGLASGVGWVLFGPGDTADVGMIFLLAVVVAALRYGSGPSLLAAALSGAGFAFGSSSTTSATRSRSSGSAPAA